MAEKKQYPSQLNSKTISARIPVQDYVNFLNESIELGISLNDFLLRKIYSNNKVGNVDKVEENDVEVIYPLLNFINRYEFQITKEVSDVEDFWDDKTTQIIYNNPLHAEDIVGVVIDNQKSQKFLYTLQEVVEYIYSLQEKLEEIRISKRADLLDVKNQLTILIQDKFENFKDRNSYRKELYSLLKELE